MKITPHILLVDDDFNFSEITREYLDAKGCKTVLKHNADSGLLAFKHEHFDLCVLDVKMPMKNGFELAEEIRALDGLVPIIFLTGQTHKEDRIKGLKLGADDYVTKPFSMEELYLRIRNILKRTQFHSEGKQEMERYQIGQFSFDATSRQLFFLEETIRLTAIEASLLKMFCDNENGLLERNLALKRIWGDDDLVRGRSLNVYVSKLRSFLKRDKTIEILNVHGIGYKMVVM
ncbi:MAG: response regulator transcription factor [Saprospiraceae bacterium]|nr:response regulator transcription factor [Saprospiraceae bacterium]MCB9322446.1 response regulator transcription factor [Lewinellaceae bacterium]